MSITHTALIVAFTLALFVGLTAADKPASPLNATVKDIDGKEVNLADKYKGKVLLVVNVASECGYTKQYKGLEALNDKYGEKGLEVLGFPCNQFGGQEPGSEEEIKAFCQKDYGVSFDLFSKVDVNGAQESPFFKQLKATAPTDDKGADIKWNFEKFLIGRDGKVIARYRSNVTPEELAKAIEAELAKPEPKA